MKKQTKKQLAADLKRLRKRIDRLVDKQIDDDSFIRTKCVAQSELIEQLTRWHEELEGTAETADKALDARLKVLETYFDELEEASEPVEIILKGAKSFQPQDTVAPPAEYVNVYLSRQELYDVYHKYAPSEFSKTILEALDDGREIRIQVPEADGIEPQYPRHPSDTNLPTTPHELAEQFEIRS